MSDVGEKARLLNVHGSFREFQQGLVSWTADTLRIGEVLMDDPFKGFKEFLFRAHSALPGGSWSPNLSFGRIPRLAAGVDENLCVSLPDAPICILV